jgi:hypothetical protein
MISNILAFYLCRISLCHPVHCTCLLVNITIKNTLEKRMTRRLYRTKRNGEKKCRSARVTLLHELMPSPPNYLELQICTCRARLMEPGFRLKVMGLIYVTLRPLSAKDRIWLHVGSYVRFAMDKVAVGPVFFSEYFIAPMLHAHLLIYHIGYVILATKRAVLSPLGRTSNSYIWRFRVLSGVLISETDLYGIHINGKRTF